MEADRLRKSRVSFTQVPNALICSDKLTCKAKAVYCYLISRPDDWQFYNEEITKNMFESLNTVKKSINELISFGWVKKTRIRDNKGRFTHTVYDLYYDISSTNQKTTGGISTGGISTGGELVTTNTNKTNKEKSNTNKSKLNINDLLDFNISLYGVEYFVNFMGNYQNDKFILNHEEIQGKTEKIVSKSYFYKCLNAKN